MSVNLDIPGPLFAFLKSEIVLTLATSIEDQPHCCNCFYALDEEAVSLVFKSSFDSRHVIELSKNEKVGGTIYQNYGKGHTKGIQFKGLAYAIETEDETTSAKELYYGKYPFARVVQGAFYKIMLNELKMTEKKLAIGKEYVWKRNVKFEL